MSAPEISIPVEVVDAAINGWFSTHPESRDQQEHFRIRMRAALAAAAYTAAPAAGDALPTIKGAAITGGYVVVTPAGWGEDKPQKVRDAILRLFPVNPAYTPKPEADAAASQQQEG